MKKYLLILTALCIFLLSVAVCAVSENAGDLIKIQKIVLNENEALVLSKGSSFTCQPTIIPENVTAEFEWNSSDPAIATVKNGTIKGVNIGECDISCNALDGSETTAVCHVIVSNAVKKIIIDEKQVSLLIGGKEDSAVKKLKATVSPEDTFWKDVTWASSDDQVVTVDEKGILRGISAGKAKITALSTQPGSKVKAQIQVVVSKAVESISFEQKQSFLLAGKTISLKPIVSPDSASNKKVEWYSEDKSIASVNSKGQIKGNSFGTTKIIAKAADGNDAKAEIEVKVVKPELTVSIDADTYDYAKSVAVTAKICNPDGTTAGLDEIFPDAYISATLQTKSGKKVPGFIVQKSSSLSIDCDFPMADEDLEAGDYMIHVETNVLKLKADSAVFHYTADKSWLPNPNDCNIELEISSDTMNLNEDFQMTAIVTDKDGNLVPGIKVGFQVLTMNRESTKFFSYDWLWNVTKSDGRCGIRCTRDEEDAKRFVAGQYIVRVFIVNAAGSDEKTFEFTGKEK